MSALLLPALAAGSSGQGALYVDDVFSTYLYTGNGSQQAINNGIDLAGKGGLVWTKVRGTVSNNNHHLIDTARGRAHYLFSNSTGAEDVNGSDGPTTGLTSFNNNGFSLGQDAGAACNTLNGSYASWTFRKAPKFFDVVTYTGNGVSGRQISHNLELAPGLIIIKRTDSTGDWWCAAKRSDGDYVNGLKLNSNVGSTMSVSLGGYLTSTYFVPIVASGGDDGLNVNGATYVAYLFAHDPSAEGIIQCGSYTGNGSTTGPIVTLGQEPQYLMIKNASGTGNWQIIDSMRGMPVGSADATLQANLSNAESSADYVSPTATGFQVTSTSSEVNTSVTTYIYLAIRRPNKPPTTGTEVFAPVAYAGDNSDNRVITGGGFPADALFVFGRNNTVNNRDYDRLRGKGSELEPNSTAAEISRPPNGELTQNGFVFNWSNSSLNTSGNTYIAELFKRAPGFFDVVCDTGTGAAHAIAHNLTKVPELIIRKSRSAATQWEVWHSALAATEKLVLNSNAAKATDATAWNSVLPTTTQFTVGTGANVNANAATFVTYLFATLAGISKVGSYTGNGSSQTIDCGFSAGARFFLVKATSTTGSWWVYDSARGIVSAADPALQLNSIAAEITSVDAVDPASVGIIVNQEATCSINATGVSYIFLAIA